MSIGKSSGNSPDYSSFGKIADREIWGRLNMLRNETSNDIVTGRPGPSLLRLFRVGLEFEIQVILIESVVFADHGPAAG